MKRTAVTAAEAAIRKAGEAVARLSDANSHESFESAWTDFLVAANRVYTKLEQGAKSNGASNGWFGRQKHIRKTDPLLQYIHQARDQDEHGIEKVSRSSPAGVGIGTMGHTFVERMTITGGKITDAIVRGDPLTVTRIPESYHLVAVTNRGTRYAPPNQHLGVPLADISPVAVANHALIFLRKLAAEAATLSE